MMCNAVLMFLFLGRYNAVIQTDIQIIKALRINTMLDSHSKSHDLIWLTNIAGILIQIVEYSGAPGIVNEKSLQTFQKQIFGLIR